MSGQDLSIRPTQAGQAPGGLDAQPASPDGVALSLDLDEVLSATCKSAVSLLKVAHAVLVVFDPGHETGHVISEYPALGTRGLTIPLPGRRAADFRRPFAAHDILTDAPSGPAGDILREHGIESVLTVPVVSRGRGVGSLGLGTAGGARALTAEELKLCEALAAQAAAVIELYEQNRQRAEQLAAIQNAVLAVNTKGDLRSVLDTITSQAVQLVGAMDGGISQFHPERGELTVIADYKFPHFIGKTIRMEEGLAGHVIRDDLPSKAVPDYNNYAGKAPVFARTERFGAVLMVNLKWQNRTVGVLYINAERGHRFPEELPPLLNLLAGAAATAIANSHLLHEVEIARARIRSTYEASSSLAALPTSGQVLQKIANRSLELARAEWVRLMLIAEPGPRRNFIASRGGKLLETDNKVRPNGLSMRVLRTGTPYRCPDVSRATDDLNPAMVEEGSRAALCLPLSCRGRQLGVIWFHYPEPYKLPADDDEEALAAYLGQAAVAYDNARQMEEQLEPLLLAVEGVAAADTTEEVLERIVTSAREFLHADAAILWPYADSESPLELPVREAVTAGVDEALREEVLNEALPVGEITRRAMGDGWVGFPDIDGPAPLALPEVSRNLLRRLDARSFEGLGLTVAGERLGVLYLVYKDRREFRVDETRRACTFASHAALALKKARLVDQVTKAHRAARKLTELTALRDMKETLEGVVARTKEVLGCDAVTLFIYDASTDRILPLTTMTGVRFKKRATHCEDAPRSSIVYRMLERREPYRVADVSEDPLFRGLPFVEREGIESVCAIPLRVRDNPVGVMFVNYRTRHVLAKEESDIIALFANQAAVAIRNTLLYEELKKRLGEQQLLATLSKQMLGANDLTETLELAVQSAADSLRPDCIAIVLRDGDGRSKFACWRGWAEAEVKSYESARARGEEYQTDYTIEHGKPVLVTDYGLEDRFTVPKIVTSRGIKSGLSVPMFAPTGSPVGAVLAHYRAPRTPTELRESAGTLSLIANLTAISVQHHDTVRSKIASLEAVQLASDEISRIRLGTDRREVLDRIVEQAVGCLPQAFMGTIQLYDEARNELRFESVYTQDGYDRLLKLERQRRPLVRRPGRRDNRGRIGIAGRAVLEKKPQLVADVKLDPDYYKFSPETRSELAVPLLTDDNRVLGVLNIESKTPDAFSKDDEQALLALAKLVVATVQNAEQYRLLENAEQFRLYKETRELVDSSTTLAWLGMASNDWGHSVAGLANNIRGNLEMLRRRLNECVPEPGLRRPLEDKISFIDEMAEQILQKPIAALLSLDAPLEDVYINELVGERVGRLRGDPGYKGIRPELILTEKNPRVRCSPDWVRRMLDILIDNGVEAMAQSAERRLRVSTRVVGNQVEIAVADTGPGIPPEVKYKLFRQRIDKAPGSKGLGIGLLMVQAIARVYRGGARVGRTGPKGTTMYVRLPVVEHS